MIYFRTGSLFSKPKGIGKLAGFKFLLYTFSSKG